VNNYKDNNKENELVNSLVAGREKAYRQVIGKYRDPVLRLCKGFTGSADDAEDLAQDIFIEVFRSVGRFKGDSSLSTWIYRIAVNKSLNFIRDKNNKAHGNYTVEGYIENSKDDDSADQQLIRKDHARALHQAIESLPENQNTAFVLSKYEDMSYADIADIMQTSVSSVESLLFRAKKNLQKFLYDYYRKNMK